MMRRICVNVETLQLQCGSLCWRKEITTLQYDNTGDSDQLFQLKLYEFCAMRAPVLNSPGTFVVLYSAECLADWLPFLKMVIITVANYANYTTSIDQN